MKGVFDQLTGRSRSASTAKERLQLVLIHDRANLPPGLMEDLKDDLIEVISQHVKVNREAVRIEIAQDGRQQRLIADIPIQPSQRGRAR